MNKRANSESIPMDLIPEIFSRLPAKSIGRFRSVSKLWDSILRSPYFNELFLTKSSSNPRLLILVVQDGEWFFFSTPQPQNSYESSSLVVATDSHMKLSKDTSPYYCSHASALIYIRNMGISREVNDEVHVICNPSTGQNAILPSEPSLKYRSFRVFLGIDPIGKQYKDLVINYGVLNGELVQYILTLGTGKASWRKIQCSISHYPFGQGICINGVLYYLALLFDERNKVIVCFDVRSEKFKILYLTSDFFHNGSTKLINYKGKLGVVNLKIDYDSGFPHKLFMWVLEDVEKHTCSSYVYIFFFLIILRFPNFHQSGSRLASKDLPYIVKAKDNIFKVKDKLSVVGATARGEIVLAKKNAWKPFYVFYFNPERNTFRSVEIQGVSKEEDWLKNHRVYIFVDHVEDLQFDIRPTRTKHINIT